MSDRRRVSRRRFLTGLGVAGTAAVAAGYGLTVWEHGDAARPAASPCSQTVRP